MKRYNTDAIMRKVKANRPKVVKQALDQQKNEKEVSAQKVLIQGHKALSAAAKKEAQVYKQKLAEIDAKKEAAVKKAQRTRKKNRRNQTKKS